VDGIVEVDIVKRGIGRWVFSKEQLGKVIYIIVVIMINLY
jgi:hypothetical protein